MALNENELFSSSSKDAEPRVWPRSTATKTFGTSVGEETLERLTPVAFNHATGYWQAWGAPTSEVTTLTAHAATPASAGDFTLTVNGETTAAIAFDATAAEIQAALEALGGVDEGDVVAVATAEADLSVADAIVTLNWGGKLSGDVVVTADQTGISAGSDFVLATSTVGVDANGGDFIRGFLWEELTLSATDEKQAVVMMEGDIDYRDIALPSGETAADLKAALRDGPRALNLHIKGLDAVR